MSITAARKRYLKSYRRQYREHKFNKLRENNWRCQGIKNKDGSWFKVLDFLAILEKQQYRCALCPRTIPGGMGNWHVDHNHKTGVVRGLLCVSCNLKVGHVESLDLPKILSYLSEN